MGEPGEHYFSATPDSPSAPTTVELNLPDVHLTLRSDRGVFAHGAIDSGTRFLLSDGAPVDEHHRVVADVGCGYGPVAMVLARRAPWATVWAVDVNERARALCAANAEALGLPNVEVCSPDDLPAEVVLDAFWSNPPIRIGKAALHELLATWLGRVRPGGSAHLVVQRHLGADSLQRWLGEHGWPTVRRASRAGYRLLDVTVPALDGEGSP